MTRGASQVNKIGLRPCLIRRPPVGALDLLPSDFCICLGSHDALFCHLAAAPLVLGMVLVSGTAVSVIFFLDFHFPVSAFSARARDQCSTGQFGAVQGSLGHCSAVCSLV